MKAPSALEDLIQALRCLPGVGPKASQRMAYHLLQYDRAGAEKLGLALVLLSLTAGCGQKGPLALPAPAPAASAVHSN